MKNIHIGLIIKQKVMENSMTIKEFADRINSERTTVYHIFKQKSIDIDKLIIISEALNYDFIFEIYVKEKITCHTEKIFIAVEVDFNSLQQLILPDNFIQLVKK